MQQPTCANCQRRNESCDYPTQVEERAGTPPPDQLWGLEYVNATSSWALAPGVDEYDRDGSSTQFQAQSAPPSLSMNAMESEESYCERTRILLDSLLGGEGSWFSPQEAAMWAAAVAKSAPKFPYLQHCIQALVYMRYHNQNGLPWPSTNAYHHQLEASRIFREATPSVGEGNWLPVLAFAIIMLIFEFGSQNYCDEEHFDVIETLRALRSTFRIEEAARPFFRRTRLWKLILARTSVPRCEPDVQMMYLLPFLTLEFADYK